MGDHHDLPFKSEYAKSGRASCKGCKGSISKDSLRMALMVQSPMFDGKIPNWFHYACFWKRGRPTTHTDISGFDALRWDDQKKIKDKIGGGAGDPADNTVPGKTHNDFTTEYAKSNRSTCRGCGDKIDKDLVRISKKEFNSERAKMYGPEDLWHHVECFVENREDLGFGVDLQPNKILGFGKLKKEDQEELVKKLGKGSLKKKSSTASKADAKKPKKETKEEKALREQSQLIWEIRDKLTKEVSNDALKGLLEYNDQALPAGESRLLDRVSDNMAFGALKPCKECQGQFAYSGDGYHCTGNVTEWTKCMNVTKKPDRKPFKVPKEYNDVEFLKNYKYVKRERIFPKDTVATTSGVVSAAADAAAINGPLAQMKFVIIGKTKSSRADLTKTVMDMGGSVVLKTDKSVVACISTKEEVSKNSKAIKEAKKADVHVVNEDFLDAVKKGGAALLIQSHSICDWGSDPLERIPDTTDGPSASKSAYKSGPSKKEESMYTKSVPSKMKMTVKGGAAVDSESGLESSAHVLSEKGELYNVVLGLVDIARGTNSYYKLQILQSDKGNRYWLFRAWGRVGTTIGGNKLEPGGSHANVVQRFKDLYADKTGNEWENRKNFTKYPSKFYPLDIDYGDEDEGVQTKLSEAGGSSKLPKPVQDLVKMIFDVESMKAAMLEFEIDLKKMPLGKLSKKQIESAYKVLTELLQLIEDGGTATKFLDASNRFYTLIPHDFGLKKPPMLDSKDIIKNKTEMLDNLLEIEVAYNMLKGGGSSEKDPIDIHFEKLKTEVDVVDKKSEEFQRIKEYVKNTHAATHNQYDLEVEDLFKLKREGEAKRYKPFKGLHNRQLLWHGSRTTNYAGILSQGLRIAPPEAPVTGYMFGKGIYFADMVSKSANYCFTNKQNPTGFLLLCEVALGNMHELNGASYITQLPKGKHSTKGCGMTAPDSSGSYTTEDGVIIPMGKGQSSGTTHSSLLYNEYIVYDVSQVSMKYLIRMKFKHKSFW